jgi:ABC-type transport system substrate-binding protein
MPVQRPYNPNAKLMAEMLQSDWAKVGIKARSSPKNGDTARASRRARCYADWLSGGGQTRTTGWAPHTVAMR